MGGQTTLDLPEPGGELRSLAELNERISLAPPES